ncbi:hypothetical protein MAPG_08605 [Magnaporthiopsis poae ATCC 64411]|uniref:Uncharacterized protein n=1 Tax=Magnaporthiopsis poae (strain ATCC 64411 / 73-15) TaxID=644358 RepID=A0A0C4E7T3_MAGP6|nr:hypothetical protein MAPG_08605 [Magnaporthiopsis poae ATCC 64411]
MATLGLSTKRFITRRQSTPPAQYLCWKDDDGFWYTHEEAPDPLPATTPLPPGSHIRKVWDAGDSEVEFTFGKNAVLKIKDMARIRKGCVQFRDCTEEHVTLAWLAERRDRLSFAVPDILHFSRREGREYTIVSCPTNTFLSDMWRGSSEDEKQHYAGRIIEICEEMASAWSSNSMTGVDAGHGLLEAVCLRAQRHPGHDVVVNTDGQGKGSMVGLMNWEMAGYVPLEWIRTKLASSWGLDFAWPDVPGGHPSERELKELLDKMMGEKGLPDVTRAYKQRIRENIEKRNQ